MQFNIEAFFKMIEERFGRGVTTGLLLLVAVALAVFCAGIIWDNFVRPVSQIIGTVDGHVLRPTLTPLVFRVGGTAAIILLSTFFIQRILLPRLFRKAQRAIDKAEALLRVLDEHLAHHDELYTHDASSPTVDKEETRP